MQRHAGFDGRVSKLDIGYSDHNFRPAASLCAVAMGARSRTTFCHDKNGPDHMLSADAEMKWLVDAIREFEVMKGTGIKRPADCETTTRINNRKSLVVGLPVKAGERLTADNVKIKRPGYGIQPRFYEQVLGRAAAKDLEADAVLDWKDLA